MSVIAEHDQVEAEAFYHRSDSVDLVHQYRQEMDSEVRSCWIKTARYILLREDGLEPFYATLNACRRAPGASNVDRHFSEQARHKMESMGQTSRDGILQIAKRAGISTQGKFYVGGLGKYSDPHAWVSSAEDLVSVCKAKNMKAEGLVRHEPNWGDPPKRGQKGLAPDIMQRHVNRILASEPATLEKVKKQPKKINEVRERVLDKHLPARKRASD